MHLGSRATALALGPGFRQSFSFCSSGGVGSLDTQLGSHSCHSEWASPCFVLLKKAAREWRLMVDYHGLNAQMQHDSYTLPLIEDMLQKQFGRRIFTVIDVKHGYHQMPLAEGSPACTVMRTPLGPL